MPSVERGMHSHVHNEGTVSIIMTGCIAHARNGRISTPGLKSDVTIRPSCSPTPISFRTREFWRFAYIQDAIGLRNICMGLQDLLA